MDMSSDDEPSRPLSIASPPSVTSSSIVTEPPPSLERRRSAKYSEDNGRGGDITDEQDEPVRPDYDDDTFNQLLSIHVDQPVGSMSISPAGRDVALGGRKGLWIVDLQNPYDPPRFLPHDSAWEVADVQWNPFPARSEWVASTSAHQAIVYNLSFSPSFATSPVEHRLQAHTRVVTDINWSPGSPDVLATCGLDGWVWSWDLRTGYGTRSGTGGGRKPVWGVCSWGSSATQVKWNRREPHIVASAHDNKVLIWDDRMGAAPLTEIQGHNAKIYGIDWSRKDSKKLVTCSLDKSFKSWNIDRPSTSLLSVQTASPVWRARFLPFGEGVLTLPQRTDHALSIWGREKVERGDTAEPVARFEGSREGVKEFVWRTRGGRDIEHDDRSFQLVTWSKDRRLRLWPISDEILKEVGHVKGRKIDIPMTRRGAPDISYRTFQDTPAPVAPFLILSSPSVLPKHLAPGPSLLSASLSSASPPTPSLLTSSLLAASLPGAPSPLSLAADSRTAPEPLRTSATMTTTRVRTRKQKAHDRLAWMEGVKVIKPQAAIDGEVLGDITAKASNAGATEGRTMTRASSPMRGTDAGTAREGGDTEKAESLRSPGGSTKTGTALQREAQHANLGEEITSAVRRFPRINFEKVHVAGRTCTVSLYSPLFIRATFTFPKKYPYSAAPTIDIERNVDIPIKSRAFLLQSIRKLMANRTQRGMPCFEQALRFLLGDRSSFESKALADGDNEDDDDDAEEAIEEQGITAVAAEILKNNLNVPPPRRGGAVFGPGGQLVVYFPTNVVSDPITEREDFTIPQKEQTSLRRGPVRVSEAFGYLPSAIGDAAGGGDEYQETDEALQMATARSVQSSALYANKPEPAATAPAGPAFSTLVHVKDVSHLTIMTPQRIVASLGEAPLDVARRAAERALEMRDTLLIRVWETMACLLGGTGQAGESNGVASQLETVFAERVLPEMLSYLVHLRDIQTLGIIACLLEACRRDAERAHVAVKHSPKSPMDDYFSHHPFSEPTSSYSDTARTPLATSTTYRSKQSGGSGHSPKPSWANLSGFFNSSVLSLKSGTPPTPGSPDTRYPGVLARAQSASATSASSMSTSLVAPSPLKSPMRQLQQAAQSRSSDSLTSMTAVTPLDRPLSRSRRSSRGRARGSPNVTFGGTSVALIQGKGTIRSPGAASPERSTLQARRKVNIEIPRMVTLHRPACWWMTAGAQLELELIRLAYAELLHRWGFDFERLQVLKYCRSTPREGKRKDFGPTLVQAGNGFSTNSSIELLRACSSCGTETKTPGSLCQNCRRRPQATKCSFCHLPILGLSQACSICCHVGHIKCLQEWFSAFGGQEEACPAGCGCRCVTLNGLSGVLVVAPPKPAMTSPPVQMRSRSVWGMRSSLPFFA